jgi:hypothetical protein
MEGRARESLFCVWRSTASIHELLIFTLRWFWIFVSETENVLNILEFWLVVLCFQFVIVSLTGWGVAIYGGYKIFAGGKKEEVHWIKLSLLQLRKLYLLACSYVDYECDLPCLFVYNWVLQCCYDVR